MQAAKRRFFHFFFTEEPQPRRKISPRRRPFEVTRRKTSSNIAPLTQMSSRPARNFAKFCVFSAGSGDGARIGAASTPLIGSRGGRADQGRPVNRAGRRDGCGRRIASADLAEAAAPPRSRWRSPAGTARQAEVKGVALPRESEGREATRAGCLRGDPARKHRCKRVWGKPQDEAGGRVGDAVSRRKSASSGRRVPSPPHSCFRGMQEGSGGRYEKIRKKQYIVFFSA